MEIAAQSPTALLYWRDDGEAYVRMVKTNSNFDV